MLGITVPIAAELVSSTQTEAGRDEGVSFLIFCSITDVIDYGPD
jgi:hypothetical protein